MYIMKFLKFPFELLVKIIFTAVLEIINLFSNNKNK